MLESIKFSNDSIIFIDQTKLPLRLRYIKCKNIDRLCLAIKQLEIRGAPLIGISVALGYALTAVRSKAKTYRGLKKDLYEASKRLRNTRPTAINLFWALDRMEHVFFSIPATFSLRHIKGIILREALQILKEDKAMCHKIGIHGAQLIRDGDVILTHCNAGILATSGSGTALSILYEAKRQGKRFKVYVDETRPLLQGARLTMWELMRHRVDAILISDSMAGSVMANKQVTKVIVGADRISRNYDIANKIGTYGLAVLAHYHRIPFYVAAPTSTFDKSILSGEEIPIEERPPKELVYVGTRQIAPLRAKVYNPAFDVTPHKLITALITEKGIYEVK